MLETSIIESFKVYQLEKKSIITKFKDVKVVLFMNFIPQRVRQSDHLKYLTD